MTVIKLLRPRVKSRKRHFVDSADAQQDVAYERNDSINIERCTRSYIAIIQPSAALVPILADGAGIGIIRGLTGELVYE